MEQKTNHTMAWVIAVAAVLVVLGAGAYILMNNNNTNNKSASTSATPTTSSLTPKTQKSTAPLSSTTIVFTDDGFSKPSYSTKAGEAITVKNDSSGDVQFSSDDHPTHLKEPELNMSSLAPGESGTFTPTKVGTWGFHDHIRSEFTGSIVVTK